MYIGLIMLLAAVLAALSVVSLVKNFLVNFNVSDNGWKTILIAVLVVICLFCSLISYSEAYTIRDISSMQPSVELQQEELDQLKSQIPARTEAASVSICISFAAYLLHWLLIRNVKESKLKEMKSSKGRRWTALQ